MFQARLEYLMFELLTVKFGQIESRCMTTAAPSIAYLEN